MAEDVTAQDQQEQPNDTTEDQKGGDQQQDSSQQPQEQQPPEIPTVEVDVEGNKQLEDLITDVGFTVADVDAMLDSTGKIPEGLKAALIEKHGEVVGTMIAENMESKQAQYTESLQQQDKALHSHLEDAFKGITDQPGEETWKELKEWAGKNIEEKDEINTMLAAGGLQAKMAIDFLVNKFKGSDAFTQPAQLETGDDLSNDYRTTPLSKEGYDSELRKLMNDGKSYESPEVKQLQARRLKALNRGQ